MVRCFGDELRRRRKEKGFRLNEFSRSIGYSSGYVSKVERGVIPASRRFAEACALALESYEELVALIDEGTTTGKEISDMKASCGLPVPPSHFSGRSAQLDRLVTFLTDESSGPLCVLSGMPGSGKTALALQGAWKAAAHFSDGCLFFDAGHESSGGVEDILLSLLRLLDVPEKKIPPRSDAMASLWRSQIAGKRLLLVLDNVLSSADVVPLLSTEPGCKVIVTSRKRLSALDDAARLTIGVMKDAEADALFRTIGGEQAARAADHSVRAVVDHCGRLPLAVRIAAARLRNGPVLTVEELEARLSHEAHRLELLDDGDRSVTAALTVSCDALSTEQRRVLALLALYPGPGIDLHSVAALANVTLARAALLVDGLADVHLVSHESSHRITVHSLVRQFAGLVILPQISIAEQQAATRRLLDHGLRLAVAADKLLTPQRYRPPVVLDDFPVKALPFDNRIAGLSWLESEWRSLVALCHTAADIGLHSLCWQLAFALRDFFFLTKRWGPWIETHLRAVECARAGGTRAWLAISLHNLGVAHSDRGDLTVAVGYFKQSLALYQELDDDHGVVNALSSLAWTELYLGDYVKSMDGLRRALMYYRRLGNTRNAAITLRGIALLEAELELCPAAVRHAQQARAEFHALGLDLDAVMAVNCAAWAHFRSGDHDAARACYEEALALADGCASRYEKARSLTGLGNIQQAAGHRDRAAELWKRADALYGGLEPMMLGEARVRLAS